MSTSNIFSEKELKVIKSKFSNNKYKKEMKKLKKYEELSKQELINTMLILSMWKPNETISSARKMSIFRYGGKNHKEVISDLINSLLHYKDKIQFSSRTIEYLKKKEEFRSVAFSYKQLDNKIENLIDILKKENIFYTENEQIILSDLKYDLLSILDSWFLAHQYSEKNILKSKQIFYESNYINKELERYNTQDINEKMTIKIGEDISSFTLEEISAGISYLYKK